MQRKDSRTTIIRCRRQSIVGDGFDLNESATLGLSSIRKIGNLVILLLLGFRLVVVLVIFAILLAFAFVFFGTLLFLL